METFAATPSCRSLVNPSSPLLRPSFASPSSSSSRYKNAILKRHITSSSVYFPNSNISPLPRLSTSVSLERGHPKLSPLSAISALDLATTSLWGEGSRNLQHGLPRRFKALEPMRAFKNDFFRFKVPVITEKPEWWWRTLACVPYLIALQISDVGYYLQPFLENHEFIGDMIYFIPGAVKRWPSWFFMAYAYFSYVWLVKNKELPHYFRFHLMMGMLLETALQIIWCTSNFFPLIHFNGRFGMYYWAAVGFSYIFILLECIRCALAGIYAQIPFISDAAFIHTLFNLGGFQRPLR